VVPMTSLWVGAGKRSIDEGRMGCQDKGRVPETESSVAVLLAATRISIVKVSPE